MKKKIIVFSTVTIVFLLALMVLNTISGWGEMTLFPPAVVAVSVIFAGIGTAKKKKIFSVISLLLGGLALFLCLTGVAVAVTHRGHDWINWVNVLWYGCYSLVATRFIICSCLSEEKRTKINRIVTVITAVFAVVQVCVGFMERGEKFILLPAVITVSVILVALCADKDKRVLAIIALSLSSLIFFFGPFINVVFSMRMLLMGKILRLIALIVVVLSCRYLIRNRAVRIKEEPTCPQCGSLLVPGKKFCTNCGAKISVENETQNTEEKGE